VKLKRKKTLDVIISIIAYMIIILSVITAVLILLLKDHPKIKGGGYDFLIIIIVGSLINGVYVLLLTKQKTKAICYQMYLYKNTGFSLVFGSILVKTLRIFKIFCRTGRLNLGIPKKVMYLIVFLITIFHWITAFLWIIFKRVDVKSHLTKDYKEYQKCGFPVDENISLIFNCGVLMSGLTLSYFIRNVDKKYKENLVVPAYAYIVFTVIRGSLNLISEIDINIQDSIDAIGSIISIFVVLYYLFFTKIGSILFGDEKVSSSLPPSLAKVLHSSKTVSQDNLSKKKSNVYVSYPSINNTAKVNASNHSLNRIDSTNKLNGQNMGSLNKLADNTSKMGLSHGSLNKLS